MFGRSFDYSQLSPAAQRAVVAGFLACFTRSTPREQLSAVLGLTLGLAGFDLGDPRQMSAADRARLDALFDDCADAVLGVLAAAGAGLHERPGGGRG